MRRGQRRRIGEDVRLRAIRERVIDGDAGSFGWAELEQAVEDAIIEALRRNGCSGKPKRRRL